MSIPYFKFRSDSESVEEMFEKEEKENNLKITRKKKKFSRNLKCIFYNF